MAEFESSDCTKKIVLESSNIEISGIRCEMEQDYNLATLVISKFYQLKNDIQFIIPLFELNGEMRFIKKRSHHTIKICAYDLGNMTAYVLYEKMKTSKPVLAEHVADTDYYVIVIPSSVVENAQNTFLKDGKLLIHIKCGESENVLKRMHACSGKREKCSEERLAEDLISVSMFPHDTDIILHAEEQTIRVPKGLLSCRSNYFNQYPDADKIYLNAHFHTVLCAVQYLYTGKLPDVKELNGQKVYGLLEVATSLKIRSLESKCLSFINLSIIQGDVETRVIELNNEVW